MHLAGQVGPAGTLDNVHDIESGLRDSHLSGRGVVTAPGVKRDQAASRWSGPFIRGARLLSTRHLEASWPSSSFPIPT